MIMGVFVDDLLPSYSPYDGAEWKEIQRGLVEKYNIKEVSVDTGLILGMKISRDRKNRSLKIDLTDYVHKMLNEYQMTDCKPNYTPTSSYKLSWSDSESAESDPSDPTPTEGVNKSNSSNKRLSDSQLKHLYQQMVGSLNFASITVRPDITYAVHVLSLYLSQPGPKHLSACKTLLRYLKGTSDIGLIYKGQERKFKNVSAPDLKTPLSFVIEAYSDSDWAGDLDDRHSTTGYVIKLNQATVSWRSKKQKKAALSSCEAEYYAMCATIQEVIWFKQFLHEILQHDVRYTPDSISCKLYVDNQSAIQLSKNDIHHDRSKHILLRYHFVREEIKTNSIQVIYVPTTEQVADIMTKGLGKVLFHKFRVMLLENSALG
jgi:hypothetical protein